MDNPLEIIQQNVILSGNNPVFDIDISSDGDTIAIADNTSVVLLWSISLNKQILAISTPHSHLLCVKFSPDGQMLVTTSYETLACIWNVADGKLLYILKEDSDAVHSVTFNIDGTIIVTGGDDKWIRLWDSRTGELLKTLKHKIPYSVSKLVYSADGRYLASGCDGGLLYLWETSDYNTFVSLEREDKMFFDKETNQYVEETNGHSEWINAVAFSEDSLRLASGDTYGRIIIWDCKTGQYISSVIGHELTSEYAASSSPSIFGLAYIGNQFLVSGSRDKTLRIWNAGTNEELFRKKFAASVHCLAYSPSNNLLIHGNSDGSIYLWAIR